MSRLLNALLDISKLESGVIKLDLTDFDLAPLFEQLRRDFRAWPRARDCAWRSIRRRCMCIPIRRWCPSCCAIYCRTPSSTRRAARWSCAAKTGASKLHIEVRDTGVGIAPEQVGLIFEEFYQVGVSPNSSRDGYGLGLSIVQRIARLLEMRIEVNSELGRGSIFAFELPTATAPQSKVPRRPAGSRVAVPCRPAKHDASCSWRTSPACATPCECCSRSRAMRLSPVATADEALVQLRDERIRSDGHRLSPRGQPNRDAGDRCGARNARRPGVKAVLVTGDTSSAVREMQGDARLRITSKPINSDELLALVRDLLLA